MTTFCPVVRPLMASEVVTVAVVPGMGDAGDRLLGRRVVGVHDAVVGIDGRDQPAVVLGAIGGFAVDVLHRPANAAEVLLWLVSWSEAVVGVVTWSTTAGQVRSGIAGLLGGLAERRC